ncbi:TPA: hypothetical protein IB748_004836 [Escherichia coli]|nr:hypothetical protein [Escherichia coli]HAM6540029.1 hypothetical protein [Escherichia coli]
MTTIIDTNQWCGQFKRCNGCKLQSECMVKPGRNVSCNGRWEICR